MLSSWLLALPYLGAIGLCLALAWQVGRPALSYFTPALACFPGSGVLCLLLRIVLGLALLSFFGALAGATGNFHQFPVAALIIALVILSIVHWRMVPTPTGALRRDLRHLVLSWRTASLPERIISTALVLCCVLLTINSIIGAMVPDMNHDPMWYHLTVPQQWVFDQRYHVYPNVMPSAHALAFESLYAMLFLVRIDPVLCSLLHATCGIMVITLMLSTGRIILTNHSHAAWGPAAIAAIWIPAVAIYGILAPVQPKNDLGVMLWTFAGSMALWVPLLTNTPATKQQWAIGGILLATGISAKGFVLPIAAIVFLGATFSLAQKTSLKTAIRHAALSLIAMAIIYAPWMWRGYSSHGLPIFPLGQNILPINPIFQPTVNAFEKAHTLGGNTPQPLLSHMINFPQYLLAGGKSGELAIFLVIIIALLGLALTKGPWRVYSTTLLLLVPLLAAGRGFPIAFRLMAPVYCLAAPLTAHLATQSMPRLSRQTRLIVAGLIPLTMWTSTAIKQINLGQTSTFRWAFRPMLSQKDVNTFASYSEHGGSYLSLSEVRKVIPVQDRVLVLGTTYPFYLHRDMLWNDEVVTEGGIQEAWLNMTTNQARHFVEAQQINWVLYASETLDLSLAESLSEQAFFHQEQLPKSLSNNGWRLYRTIYGK